MKLKKIGTEEKEFNNKLKERNFIIFWIIVGLFALLLLWKIAVTPFELDFPILLTFLLALFTIAISFSFYIKVNQALHKIQALLDNHPVEKHTEPKLENAVEDKGEAAKEDHVEKEVEEEIIMDEDEESTIVQSFTINEATARIEAEEKTLKLKEEERDLLLEKLKANLDDDEKQMYITQLEKVDHDLFNLRSNLNQLRKKINASLSEMFILEKTKQVRDVVELLGPEFVSNGSFTDINSRFQILKKELPYSVIEALKNHEYIDSDNNLNRKGYREFLKTAKKLT